MKKRALYLIFPIAALVLEILPYGAVLNFANPEGDSWRKTFSYFDLTPFGYANFGPFLTAITTCIILIFLVVYLFTGKTKILSFTKMLLCVGVVLSLCPLLFGIHDFSIIGALITASLAAELVLIFATAKTQ